MAFLEDVIGMIMIVFFLIIGGTLLSTQITSDQLGQVDEEVRSYLYDYHSTSMNSFMNMREGVSGAPVHIIIGDYISKGVTQLTGRDGRSISVEDALSGILDEFYGEHNYFLQLRQEYTDTTISFVFDGSDSNRREREIIGRELENIIDAINEIFEDADSDAKVNVKLYVLSQDPLDEVCSVFGDAEHLCETLNAETLYENEMEPVVRRPFGDLRGRQAVVREYLESDWIGGLLHAEKEFRRDIALGDAEEHNIHVVIPVFDQLSTSSVSNECFEISSGSGGYSNYVVCRLCHEECPAYRSGEQIDEVIEYFEDRGSNSIIIPIFSFDCNLRYIYDWNSLNPSDYGGYVNTPVTEHTMCHQDVCAGCRPPSTGEVIDSTDPDVYENICFKTECQEAIEEQMGVLAEGTGGSSIDIDEIDDLPDLVVENIDDAFAERELTIGVRQDDRTRFVFERTVVLPTFGSVDIRLFVYELPADLSELEGLENDD